jgi:hypothetical protein
MMRPAIHFSCGDFLGGDKSSAERAAPIPDDRDRLKRTSQKNRTDGTADLRDDLAARWTYALNAT